MSTFAAAAQIANVLCDISIRGIYIYYMFPEWNKLFFFLFFFLPSFSLLLLRYCIKSTGNNGAAVELIVRLSLKYHGISFFSVPSRYSIFSLCKPIPTRVFVPRSGGGSRFRAVSISIYARRADLIGYHYARRIRAHPTHRVGRQWPMGKRYGLASLA